MSKYPEEIKQQALEMLKKEGYDKTFHEFGVSKSTLNVWRREAGFSLAHKSAENVEVPLQLDELVEREIEATVQTSADEREEDMYEMLPVAEENELKEVELLRAANERLRRRNKVLRETLMAVLE